MSSPFRSRHELEDLWRERLLAAQRRYQIAQAEVAKVCMAQPAGLMPSQDGAFARRHSIQIETAALREYNRVLKIFTSLTLHGTIPSDPQ